MPHRKPKPVKEGRKTSLEYLGLSVVKDTDNGGRSLQKISFCQDYGGLGEVETGSARPFIANADAHSAAVDLYVKMKVCSSLANGQM